MTLLPSKTWHRAAQSAGLHPTRKHRNIVPGVLAPVLTITTHFQWFGVGASEHAHENVRSSVRLAPIRST